MFTTARGPAKPKGHALTKMSPAAALLGGLILVS
jgi:hypothetical protein